MEEPLAVRPSPVKGISSGFSPSRLQSLSKKERHREMARYLHQSPPPRVRQSFFFLLPKVCLTVGSQIFESLGQAAEGASLKSAAIRYVSNYLSQSRLRKFEGSAVKDESRRPLTGQTEGEVASLDERQKEAVATAEGKAPERDSKVGAAEQQPKERQEPSAAENDEDRNGERVGEGGDDGGSEGDVLTSDREHLDAATKAKEKFAQSRSRGKLPAEIPSKEADEEQRKEGEADEEDKGDGERGSSPVFPKGVGVVLKQW